MTKHIKGFLLDPYKKLAVEVEIEDTLDAYYGLLGITCIDIVTRTIGGKAYTIVCDDEGLLRDAPRPSAISDANTVILVGPLFITTCDNGPDLKSLTPRDVKFLRKHVGLLHDGLEVYPAMRHVGF